MKKGAFLIAVLVSVCFFSCVEKPENDGETQVLDVNFLEESNKVQFSIFIMEHTEYLNILRGVVKDNGGINKGANDVQNGRRIDDAEGFEDADAADDNDSIEDIENIAQLIPRTSFEDSLPFEDVYVVGNTSYKYCIRYRVNGKYYFSSWSKKVTVPEGKGMTSPLYIIENGANALNIECNEENGTMTIRTIKESLLSGEFDESTERFNEEEIEVNKPKTEENETEFTVGLVFHYEEDEDITSRAFSIESLVNEYRVGGSDSKYYISSSNATNYNISVLVTPDFYGKDVVVDGFIGEQITKFEKKGWTQIVWTRITPVKLYNRRAVKNASNEDFDGDGESTPALKRYFYEPMDSIKIPELNNSDNKHDTSAVAPRAAGYAFGEGSPYQLGDAFIRDISTYYEE